MKLHVLLPLTAAALVFAACDQRGKQEAQQLSEERAALEREKADLATQRAAAQQAANDQERARLDSERAALEMEKAKLSDNREAQAAAEKNVQLAAERERRLAAERKAADEAAGRQAAEVRAREAQMTAEQARAAADQERAVAAQAAEDARAAQTVDFFYDALDPHGDWVQTDRYGYAFRPSAARDPRWRPYTDGGWVHTEYGWTWRSEEPFGWATYHYGRWARAPRLGWVWVPGSEWGPAWVSWRRSDDYVGWAPLPPDAWSASGFNAAVEDYYDIGPGLYVFLRIADFGERSYRDRCVEPERNVQIVNQTVNVTKVTYQTVQNKVTVVNNGPELAFIDRASRVPVQRATVQRMPGASSKQGRIEGNIMQLAAPVLNAFKPTTKPKSVKGEVKSGELDRGWREAREDEQKLRDDAKKAAHRAEEEERVPLKKFDRPIPEPLVAMPPRVKLPAPPLLKPAATPPLPVATPRRPATLPPLRPRATPPATPLPLPVATPAPEGATPIPEATPPGPLAPPPLRPRTTPPAAVRRALTPAPKMQPPVARKLQPPEPGAAATPEPPLNPARLRPGTVQPAVPLRKFLKPSPAPAPAGEPVPPAPGVPPVEKTN